VLKLVPVSLRMTLHVLVQYCVHICHIQCPVLKEPSDFKVELSIVAAWRFVTTGPGAQCVMILGQQLMLESPADNWDLVLLVSETVSSKGGYNGKSDRSHPALQKLIVK
jgi:hypothetical protein